ncbi:MAG: GatB/YqeY domain-containing protein [Patescibacteria group bacterium]
MSLRSKIEGDLKSAYLEKRTDEVGALRLLRAAIQNLEIDLKAKKEEINDEAILEIVSHEAKKRRESIELYEKGNRPELAEKEKKELAFLLGYLPQQLSDEEIRTKLNELVKNNNAQGISDLGKTMGLAMKELKGKADGKRVQDILKDVLLKKISNS